MSNLFDFLSSISRSHAKMYRGDFERRRQVDKQDDEYKQRIESEVLPAKMAEDLELEQ